MDQHTIINLSENIRLLLTFFESDNDDNINHIFILFDEEICTYNFCEAMQFKEQLNLFNKLHSRSKYFKVVSSNGEASLVYTKGDGTKIYITEDVARAAINIWYMVLRRYSPISSFRSCTKKEAESMVKYYLK